MTGPTGNDHQPTGDSPRAPYRWAAPQQAAGSPATGSPATGYPQAGYPQTGSSQAGYQQAGHQQAGYQQAGHQPWAGYDFAHTSSRPAAAWNPADAQRDTGPVFVVGQGGTGANDGRRSSVAVARILDPARLLGVIVVVLGVLNFLWGFLPEITLSRSDESLSVFAVGAAYVPVLLLIAGLLSLAAFLHGTEVSRLAVAAVSVGGAAGAIVSLGSESSVQIAFGAQANKGMGAILLVIFGIIQAVVAIGGYVVGADVPPWLRGAGSSGSPATAGSPATSGPSGAIGAPRPAGPPAAAASANPSGGPDQPPVPAAQWTGAWAYGPPPGGYGGPAGPTAYGGPAGAWAHAARGQSTGFAASAYLPPSEPDSSSDEPATGPQSVVGTATAGSPEGGTTADGHWAPSDESGGDPEGGRAVADAPAAPPASAAPRPQGDARD